MALNRGSQPPANDVKSPEGMSHSDMSEFRSVMNRTLKVLFNNSVKSYIFVGVLFSRGCYDHENKTS
jgi:hypothetical protein